MARSAFASVLLAVALSACASGGGAGGDPAAARRDPNVLLPADLTGVLNLSVYEAVQRLRPSWLRPRGVTSVANMTDQLPAVMVDNAFHDIDYLRSLQVGDVTLVRYVDARDATTRFGTGYVNGIVEVIMAGRRPGT